MPARFRPWTNSAVPVAFVATVLAIAVITAFVLVRMRMPAASEQGNPLEQPVAFDHRTHVGLAGIDCRYCHDLAERSPFAGVPPTARCVNCHAQVRNQSPLLDPVWKSFFGGAPIAWSRVHRLPGFVYFDHSVHVGAGVGCVTCHGRVDQMARVFKVEPMTMGWCLDCHRAPEANLRPPEEVTSMTWLPPGDGAALGREVAAKLGVRRLTDCSACHR
jgi:hypothetical protein